MKKTILWIVVVITSIVMVAMVALAGCKEETTEATTGEETETATEHVTLNFVGWEASPLETASVENGLEVFMAENPNITVEYNTIPSGGDYNSKILTMMMADTGPDVFFCNAYTYRSFIDGGYLLDITDNFNSVYNIDDYIPSSASIMSVDNKVYGISSCTVSPVIYYNKTVFDEAGLPYPPSDPDEAWTWDEFRDIAKQLTTVENGKTTRFGVYGLENSYMFSALIMANGGSYWNDNNNITSMAINSPETAEVMQAIYDLATIDGATTFVPEQMQEIGGTQSGTNLLKTGSIAMLVDGSWSLQELSKMDFDFGVAVLPKFEECKTHGQAHLHVASSQTEHPQEAWELVKFLSSDEYQLQNVKEGLWMPNQKKNYTEEGIAKWYDPNVHPEGFTDMVSYFENALVEPTAINSDLKADDIIIEEFGLFLTGEQSIEVTLQNIEDRGNEELDKFNAGE